jgi:hypothetical protein
VANPTKTSAEILAEIKQDYAGGPQDQVDPPVQDQASGSPAGDQQQADHTQAPASGEPHADATPSPDEGRQQAAGEMDQSTGPDGKPASESGKPAKTRLPWDQKPIEEKFEILDRNFRALQSVITPTQQENARLKERIAQLEAKQGKPEDAAKAIEEKMAIVRDTLPEGAEVIADLQDQIRQLRAQQTQRETATTETARTSAMGLISDAHPDAIQIAKNNDFWNFVDSHGQRAAESMRAVLANPGNYEGGADLVIDLFHAYKGTRRTASPAPRPQGSPGRPAAVQRPTDVAPAVRGATAVPVVADGSDQKAPMADSDYERTVRRNLRHARPSDARSLRDKVMEDIRRTYSR